MGTYVEIDGKLYVTKEDYLNIIKYYENSLSAERNGAKEEIAELEEEKEMLIRQNTLLQESNKKLKEEVEQLKNQRIFSSDEYDLITLTSTTPQWELRRK